MRWWRRFFGGGSEPVSAPTQSATVVSAFAAPKPPSPNENTGSKFLEKHANDIRALNDFRRILHLPELVVANEEDHKAGAILWDGMKEIQESPGYKNLDAAERAMVNGVIRETGRHLSEFGLHGGQRPELKSRPPSPKPAMPSDGERLTLKCEGCGATYTPGVDAISITAKELRAMIPAMVGSLPERIMIGRAESPNPSQLRRDAEDIMKEGPAGWSCRDCHHDNRWSPLYLPPTGELASAEPPVAPAEPAQPAVKFERDERQQHPAAPHIQINKKIYSAPTQDLAIAFLRNQTVSEPFFYIEVDTPSGRFGIDIGERIYDGQGRFIEAEPEPNASTYDAETYNMKAALETAMRSGTRQTPREVIAAGDAALRCLRIIIEDDAADFFMRRMAVWWGGQFNSPQFKNFLHERFVKGKDRGTLVRRADASQSEMAQAEAGLHIASVDVLSGDFKP